MLIFFVCHYCPFYAEPPLHICTSSCYLLLIYSKGKGKEVLGLFMTIRLKILKKSRVIQRENLISVVPGMKHLHKWTQTALQTSA